MKFHSKYWACTHFLKVVCVAKEVDNFQGFFKRASPSHSSHLELAVNKVGGSVLKPENTFRKIESHSDI